MEHPGRIVAGITNGRRQTNSRTDIPETNASKSARAGIVEAARTKNLTIRELAQKAGSYSDLASSARRRRSPTAWRRFFE